MSLFVVGGTSSVAAAAPDAVPLVTKTKAKAKPTTIQAKKLPVAEDEIVQLIMPL